MIAHRAFPLLLLLSWLATALSSCSGGLGTDPALLPHPFAHPVLDSVEPVVKTQLTAARRALEEGLQRADVPGAELGSLYGQLGTLYHAYDLRPGAVGCYRNATELDPANFRWPYFLGTLLGMDGDAEGSREAFERARELAPDYLPIHVQLARVLLEQGDASRAEALVDDVLVQEPENALALVEKGRILLGRHEFDGALALLSKVKAIYPDVTEFDYELGLAYRGLGRMDEAREHMVRRETVHRALGDPLFQQINDLRRGGRSFLSEGNVAFSSGNYELAEKKFRQAIEIDADQAGTHLNLGATLVRLGRTEDALAALRTAVRLDPRNAACHFGLGTLLSQLGEEEAGLLHLARALQLDPDSRDAAQNYANALRRVGRFEDALPLCRGIIEREPGHEAARLAEIYTLLALGRFGDAHERAEEAGAALPDSAELRYVLTRLLAASPVDSSRDGARALELARQNHALNPAKLEFNETMAMALAETWDMQQAIEFQLRALETARRIGMPDVERFLETTLEGYRSGEPCRIPFDPQGTELSPPRRVKR